MSDHVLLSDLLPRAAASYPDRAALTCGARVVTYGELHRMASQLAHALASKGIAPGDRIGLLGDPSIELVTMAHAAVAIGAIPIGVYAGFTRAELQAIVDHARFAALFIDDAYSALASQLRHAALEVPSRSIERRIASHAPLAAWHRPAPDDVALIIHTGGTTGAPKGVVHTHRSISTWLGMKATIADATENRSVLFNLAHGSGQSTLWTSTSAAGCLVLLERYPATPADLVDVLERERITRLGTLPITIREILRVPDIERRDLSALKTILVGGAPASPAMLQRAAAVFRSSMVIVGYGQTESGPMISVLPVTFALRGNRLERLGSVGRAVTTRMFEQTPFTIRILDDDGREVAPGAIGEIVVRGPQVMTGYWNDPTATAATLRDGWLYTQDLGRLDSHGYLYVVDRKRDILMHVDGKFYSSELEAVLESHPAIAEIAVVGQRVDDEGHRVAAVAALQPGATLALADLKAFCADRIAAFKMPTTLVIVPALPRTPFGKIDKVQLRRLVAAPSR